MVAETPAGHPAGPALTIVIVGHVDHGKSTLIGRLLHETDSLPTGKVQELLAVSARRGMPMEWSFALDALQAERDQAVTIDVTHVRLRRPGRPIIIVDAPGHREFLRNMVSGAAAAEAALLVVDATEGVQEQSRRHAYLLKLLGVRQVAVVINKMDAVGFDQARFDDVSATIVAYLDELGVTPRAVIPISAREGDHLVAPSSRMAWYTGPAVLDVLDRFETRATSTGQPLRLPVQDVYRLGERRVIVGRIEAGVLRAGDTVLVSPANVSARVESLEAWPGPPPIEAHPGQPVAFTLDQPLFVERGALISHVEHAPRLTNVFRSTVFWLGAKPIQPGAVLKARLATREALVTVEGIEAVVDTDTLARHTGTHVATNQVAELILRSRELLALDEYVQPGATARCVLLDGHETVAGGIVSMRGYADQRPVLVSRGGHLVAVPHQVDHTARGRRNGHRGAVIWLTGLPAAGKSTLAMQAERTLFGRGCQVYVLDGDNVRQGLNANLGFSPADRAENIRRVAEVAALFADAGLICITAFISPYRSDRVRARQIVGAAFHKVFVKADPAACEARDPKGHYRRARSGELREFTGVSAPYEEPAEPDLVVETTEATVEACVAKLIDYIERTCALGDEAWADASSLSRGTPASTR